MSNRLQLQLLFHGAVLLFIGLVLGAPYGMAISEGFAEPTIHAWRLAHTGLSAGAVALIAIGASLHHLVLGPGARRVLVWSLLTANYVFLGAILVSALWGGRGLEPTGSVSNVVVFVGYTVFAGATFVGGALFVVGTRSALRAST